MDLPKISVNIPLLTGGDASVVLSSLARVDYPKNLLEIIIVEGNHIAKQRNKAIECSSGDIIYLLDNDSQIQKNALKIIAKTFLNPRVAAVGGPSLTPTSGGNYLNQVIGFALETYFGAMRMRFRYRRQKMKHHKSTEYHLIGANLALRREAVIKVKGFDEQIVPNEETELLRRLQQHGYTLKYIEKLFIYRYQRQNVSSLARQFFRYGRGRMKQITHTPVWQDIFFLTPVLFGCYLLTLLYFQAWIYYLPLGFYFIMGIVTAGKASYKYKRFSVLLSMPLIFPVIHLSYAVGLMVEGWERIASQFMPKPYGDINPLLINVVQNFNYADDVVEGD